MWKKMKVWQILLVECVPTTKFRYNVQFYNCGVFTSIFLFFFYISNAIHKVNSYKKLKKLKKCNYSTNNDI